MYTLVTGGNGFIGKRLVKKLVEEERSVRCLVRDESKANYQKELGVELFRGDVGDINSVNKAMEDVDVVYHLAARPHPSLVKPISYYQINVDGTKNILESCITRPGIKKVVLMSSIAATGPSRDAKLLDEKSERLPITNYGRSKVMVEDMAREYFNKAKTPIVLIRPPMVYGIGDKDWVGFFRLIKQKGSKGGALPIPGAHENLFDFCYVDNLVDGLIAAEKSTTTTGQVYFLSDSRPYELKEIIGAVAKEFAIAYPKKSWSTGFAMTLATILQGLGILFRFDPPLARRDVKWMTTNYWVCNCSKAKKDFAYDPKFSLQEGIHNTIQWARENNLL